MAIPLKYNLLSLLVRRMATLMTVLSVALVVFIFVCVMALANGLETALVSSGEEANVLVLRRGSDSELSSAVSRENLQTLKYLPGVKSGASGAPEVSPEVFVIVNMPRADDATQIANVAIRGLAPVGIAMRPHLQVVEGRPFQEGLREVIVSRSLAARFPQLKLGSQVRLGKGDWNVVGIFDAGRTTFDSEIWADVDQVIANFNHQEYSSVLLGTDSRETAAAIANRIESDPNLGLGAQAEREYYEAQTWAAAPLKLVGMFIAVVMGIGACFAAMNTMYAAVTYRTREIATLRVLGFKRRSILISFLLESLLVAICGGALGCLLALPVNYITTGTTNWQTFSELSFAFRTSPSVLLTGMLFALLIGLLGGILPSLQAARLPPLVGLRKT